MTLLQTLAMPTGTTDSPLESDSSGNNLRCFCHLISNSLRNRQRPVFSPISVGQQVDEPSQA